MIDFSIIIPAYNLENCIEKTLESICKNKLDTTEIIVVNDGSQDATERVVKDYFTYNHVPHFEVISQENKGVSAARNAGIEAAQGEYLLFCDGDDLCAENLIETIELVKNTDHDMFVWRYDILQETKRIISQKEFQDKVITNEFALKSFLLQGNRIRLGSFAVKRSLLEKNGISFSVDCAIAEDIEFIYKCLAKANSVYTINDVLFTYVKRKGSAMNTFDLRRFQAPEAIKRVYQYVQENTRLLDDSELDDYLQNGLFVLHSIFSFDACMQHLRCWKDIVQFSKVYFVNFSEIDSEAGFAYKRMIVKPIVVSSKKLKIFGLSRKLYIYVYGIKGILTK